MPFFRRILPGIILLGLSLQVFPQSRFVVYDGITGITGTVIRNDTAHVASVLKKSPAYKAGLQFLDQIIQIDDSLVSGRGLGSKDIRQLLIGASGDPIHLQIKRKGEDTLRPVSIIRDPYLHEIECFAFEYLVDSLEQWEIGDIVSDSLNKLFVDAFEAKMRVRSVDPESQAAEKGLMPGDLVISLADELQLDENKRLSSSLIHEFTDDTSLIILRDSSEIPIGMNPSMEDALDGVEDRFQHDMQQHCIWFRINIENRISKDRTYLFDLPNLRGTDSISIFEPIGQDGFIEKRAGNTIALRHRDYVYRNWSAIRIHLVKGEVKTLYLRVNLGDFRGYPLFRTIAHDTIINHDRTERMLLSIFLGMMLIAALYYLILFAATHYRRFLFFSLYILTIGLFLFTAKGYFGEFSWGNGRIYSFIDEYSTEFLIPFIALFFLLFGVSYLELKRTLIWWYRVALFLVGVSGFSVILLLVHTITGGGDTLYDIAEIAMLIAVLLAPFVLIFPAILRIRSGFVPAWYFLVSNVLWVVAAILVLNTFDIAFTTASMYEPSFLTILKVSVVYIAVIIQFLVFAIGLAQKMKLDEKEKQMAQERVIEQLKENEKLKDKVNRELEQKVQERTKEIKNQKEEIEAQRDEIEAQRDEIEAQRDLVVDHRDLLSSQKQELTDSITYARQIQSAILPHQDYLEAVMPEHFILYRPRDIVSGDFYWIREVKNYLVVVAADCTGHGVPGAFMSMLGITLLNEQVGTGRLDKPGEILNRLRNKVKETLAQEGRSHEQKDGMDIALAVIEKSSLELQFAGAYNPLYIIRDKNLLQGDQLEQYYSLDNETYQLIELKGDPQPISIYAMENDFTTRTVQLEKGDTLYLFSDGFVDQKGGPKLRKFLSKNFKRHLLEIQVLSMEKQKRQLEGTLDNWQADCDQIDDILVMGIRV